MDESAKANSPPFGVRRRRLASKFRNMYIYICVYIYTYILDAKWGADLRKKGTVRNTELKPRSTELKNTINAREHGAKARDLGAKAQESKAKTQNLGEKAQNLTILGQLAAILRLPWSHLGPCYGQLEHFGASGRSWRHILAPRGPI